MQRIKRPLILIGDARVRCGDAGARAIIGLAAVLCLLIGACASGPERQTGGPTFFPPLPQTPRVQYLTSISSEEDVGARRESRFREFVVGQSERYAVLGRPMAVGHEPGKIYVVDKKYENVIIIDLETGEFDQFRDLVGGRLQNPANVFVAPNGHKYVTDMGRKQIVAYNERNEFTTTYSVAGAQFNPMDVVVYEDRLYVSDYDSNQIIIMDKNTGEILQSIGGTGEGDGSFRRPTYLSIDEAGNLFVVDSLNFRIQMFDVSGEFVKSFGWYEQGPGGLARPKGIAVDRSGHLYSVDAAFEMIQIFDVGSTDPLLFWGKRGSGPGSTYLPSDILIDYDNVEYFSQYAHPRFKLEYLIYQTNQLGDKKLNVYGFGTWTGESSEIQPQTRGTIEPTEVSSDMPSLDALTELPADEPEPPENSGVDRD